MASLALGGPTSLHHPLGHEVSTPGVRLRLDAQDLTRSHGVLAPSQALALQENMKHCETLWT